MAMRASQVNEKKRIDELFHKSEERLLSYRDNVDAEKAKESKRSSRRSIKCKYKDRNDRKVKTRQKFYQRMKFPLRAQTKLVSFTSDCK